MSGIGKGIGLGDSTDGGLMNVKREVGFDSDSDDPMGSTDSDDPMGSNDLDDPMGSNDLDYLSSSSSSSSSPSPRLYLGSLPDSDSYLPGTKLSDVEQGFLNLQLDPPSEGASSEGASSEGASESGHSSGHSSGHEGSQSSRTDITTSKSVTPTSPSVTPISQSVTPTNPSDTIRPSSTSSLTQVRRSPVEDIVYYTAVNFAKTFALLALNQGQQTLTAKRSNQLVPEVFSPLHDPRPQTPTRTRTPTSTSATQTSPRSGASDTSSAVTQTPSPVERATQTPPPENPARSPQQRQTPSPGGWGQEGRVSAFSRRDNLSETSPLTGLKRSRVVNPLRSARTDAQKKASSKVHSPLKKKQKTEPQGYKPPRGLDFGSSGSLVSLSPETGSPGSTNQPLSGGSSDSVSSVTPSPSPETDYQSSSPVSGSGVGVNGSQTNPKNERKRKRNMDDTGGRRPKRQCCSHAAGASPSPSPSSSSSSSSSPFSGQGSEVLNQWQRHEANPSP